MLSQFKSMMVCVAVATLASVGIQSEAAGQGCSTCSQSSAFGFPSDAGCGAGGCGAGGCASGRCGLRNGELRASLDQAQERNGLVAARNDAWPKPFNCIDRQLYERQWGKYIDAGYERTCVLSSMHFDQSTNELSQFGRTIVSGLVQNMPQARKVVYIHRDGDEQRSQERLENVRESIEYMFGHNTPAQVAFSNQAPVRVSALRVETLQRLEAEATPVPIIPIASGTTSVQQGAGGN
jgi:hypothetical protein